MTDNHCHVNEIWVPEHKTGHNFTFVWSYVTNFSTKRKRFSGKVTLIAYATVTKILIFVTNFHVLSQIGVWPLLQVDISRYRYCLSLVHRTNSLQRNSKRCKAFKFAFVARWDSRHWQSCQSESWVNMWDQIPAITALYTVDCSNILASGVNATWRPKCVI